MCERVHVSNVVTILVMSKHKGLEEILYRERQRQMIWNEQDLNEQQSKMPLKREIKTSGDKVKETERERERETDRQTDRQREREREREREGEKEG